ncbi:MAG: SRPBCC family protein [Chloroflexi bacterium]|nr:SRPBCC family protein [Chloroflexota bacterium]
MEIKNIPGVQKGRKVFNINANKTIYRPINQIFDFITKPENDFQWQYGTLIGAIINESSYGMGALFRTIGHFMGRRIESTFEVTEYEPNKKYGFKSLSGPMQSNTLYTFEMAAGATRVNVSMEASVINLFQVDEGILEKKMKKQIKENLEMLKNILEAGKQQPLSA